jgi:hypothetical protein
MYNGSVRSAAFRRTVTVRFEFEPCCILSGWKLQLGSVDGLLVAVSVLMTEFSLDGSRLIPCALVETTDSVRVLVRFRFKPACARYAVGVGVVFLAAGLRSSSSKLSSGHS